MPNRIEEERVPITREYKATLRNDHCLSPTRFHSQYDHGNSFYAYRHGSIHVVVLNPYTNCTFESVQYEWLHKELRDNVDRAKTPWVMAVTHNPLHTTFNNHGRPDDADAMEYLFNMYGVNLVVSGHDHGYMRSKSLDFGRNVKADSSAPFHFIVGTGGSSEGPPTEGYKNFKRKEPWVAARSSHVTGFGKLTVHNATHAEWEFRANKKAAEAWYYRHLNYEYDPEETQSLNNFTDRVWLRNPHAHNPRIHQ